MVLVAFDVNIDGAKKYCLFESRQQLKKFIINNKNAPMYEHLNNDLHKLFFDIDIKDKELIKTFNFNIYKQNLEHEINTVLNNKNLKFCWLNSSCSTKVSYHLIVNVSCSHYQNNQIKNYLNNRLGYSHLDFVYKDKQMFRMWNCSKFGQYRPLVIIGKHCFNDTLVNLYGDNNIEPINPKIKLEQKQEYQEYQHKLSQKDWITVPYNSYLLNNFIPSKYQINVYVRKNPNTSLPCPICLSKKQLCKEKHHKKISVYVFKKNDKTYLGCFRQKQWDGDRWFLNLTTNKVEHVENTSTNNNQYRCVIDNYVNKKVEFPNLRIAKILYDKVTFGKYKNKDIRELFQDIGYVNPIECPNIIENSR
jgi:hypothetical protein